MGGKNIVTLAEKYSNLYNSDNYNEDPVPQHYVMKQTGLPNFEVKLTPEILVERVCVASGFCRLLGSAIIRHDIIWLPIRL